MNRQNFDRWFRNFHYVGCAVRSRTFLYLLGRREYEVGDDGGHPDEDEIDKRVINILLDEPPDDRFGSSTLTDLASATLRHVLIQNRTALSRTMADKFVYAVAI
jgi:hypothetical protein